VRVPVNNKMGDTRGKAAQKIEQKVPKRTQSIFHIVAKYIKGPHITKEMKKSPMEKHKRQEGKELLARGKIRRNCWNCVSSRD
jgi:hypothetical protein